MSRATLCFSSALSLLFAVYALDSIPKLEPKIDLENTRELTADDKVKFIKLINALTNEQVGQVVTTLESRCPASLNEVVRFSRARARGNSVLFLSHLFRHVFAAVVCPLHS